MGVIKEITKMKLRVKIFNTRDEMGKYSAEEMSVELKKKLSEREEVNVIFAAAPSQNEFFEHLTGIPGIEWNRVNAFHMDEYIGLDPNAPQGFGNFLKDRVFGKVGFKSVNYINGNASNLEEECIRYTELLKNKPIDIVCMGIGENGHIAFNDPDVALFDDPLWVKIVDLDKKCRMQQVNDGCFAALDQVPTRAITLTIPALLSGKSLFCMVPGRTKADAVTRTICGEISQSCPASILKTHDNVILYLDRDSSMGLL